MNPYGRLAQDHMANWLPRRYASLTNPHAYFTELGETISTRVGQEWKALTSPLVGEDPTDTLRRVMHNHPLAQRAVLAELAWLTPEVPWTPDQEVARDSEGGYIGGPPGWMPEILSEQMETADGLAAVLEALGLDPMMGAAVS